MEKLLVKVKFDESENIYCYSSYDDSIKVGDCVLVDSRGYLATPKVVDIRSVNRMTAEEKEEILNDIRDGLRELKLVREGKLKLQSAREFLNELRG